jgi:hypothetical protein
VLAPDLQRSRRDCDGLVDEQGCASAPRCFIDVAGCGAGAICAATSCAAECTTDADCTEPAVCVEIKDQYGTVTGARACLASGASQCQIGCEVLAHAARRRARRVRDCMKDSAATCNAQPVGAADAASRL